MDRRDLEFCRPYCDELIVALLDGRTDQTALAHSATFWPCSSMKHVDGARFFFTRVLGPDCHAKTETSEPAIDVRVRGRRQEQGLDSGGRFDKRLHPPALRWRPCHRRASIPTAIADVCQFGWNRLCFWSWKWAVLVQTIPSVDPGSGMELDPTKTALSGHHFLGQPHNLVGRFRN